VTDPSAAVEAVARYLEGGDPSAITDPGQRDRLARARALLADGCTWAQPSPGLREAIVDRILQVARSDPLHPTPAMPATPATSTTPATTASGHPEGSGEASPQTQETRPRGT
jgi:hypothetical protein